MSRTKKSVVEEPVKEEQAVQKKEIVIIGAKAKEADPEKQMQNEKLKKLIADETKLVKGRFKIYENPGSETTVHVRKYPGIPPFVKVMRDGEMYEIPLYDARHLNGVDYCAEGCDRKTHTCAWPTHGFTMPDKNTFAPATHDDQGMPVPIIGVQKWNKRYGFESLEFDTMG